MKRIKEIYQLYLAAKGGLSTDSRKIPASCIFFALKGDNFNGNLYAKQAIDKGAAFAIIDELNDEIDRNDKRFILVENSLECLQKLANYHRNQFDIPVIALSGTNGKTTTKELIATVLSEKYKTHATKGNFNNHIGVPLTLLEMPLDTEIAIIEMGANHQGEIRELCKIAEPTHGMLTNVGKAHLEGFGGPEGVKKAKGELFEALQEGVAFINAELPYLSEMSEKVKTRYYYGEGERKGLFCEGKLLTSDPFINMAFRLDEEWIEVNSTLYGSYNFPNMLVAAAFGGYFKLEPNLIKKALENFTPDNKRSQLIQIASNTYILDAYNANPTSMKAALIAFLKLEAPHKVAILGDMLELGNSEKEEHQYIVNLLQKQNLSLVLLIGKRFGKTQMPENFIHFDETVDAAKFLQQQNFKKHSFLLKGSRRMKLEELLPKVT